jgi:hypothetical protein
MSIESRMLGGDLYNENVYNFDCSQNIISVNKSSRVRQAGHVARIQLIWTYGKGKAIPVTGHEGP